MMSKVILLQSTVAKDGRQNIFSKETDFRFNCQGLLYLTVSKAINFKTLEVTMTVPVFSSVTVTSFRLFLNFLALFLHLCCTLNIL